MTKSELTRAIQANERVPEAEKRTQPNGISQAEAVNLFLDTYGAEDDLETIRDQASLLYGRRITLGITLRLKQAWGRQLAAISPTPVFAYD